MRLHRLTLRNVRGVEERTVELSPGPDGSATGSGGTGGGNTGVVIVEGLNEAGKSTLSDALDVLLTYKDSSKHADVRSLQSTGRDDPPEIEAELQIGEHRLTYAKRYLKRTGTTLSITAPRGEQLDGDAAHERVDGLLADHLDVALWSSLRLRQAEGLAQAAPGDTRGLATALSGLSDVSAIGDRELTILEQAQSTYERYFTARAGAPKPLLRDADAKVAELTEALDRIDERRATLAADVDRADRLTRALPDLRTQVTEAAARAAEHETRRAEVTALAQEVDRLRGAEEQTTTALERLQERRARRTALIEELAEVERAQQERATALATVVAAQDRAGERLASARSALDAAQHRQQATRQARERAQQDLDHLTRQERAAALRARAERATAALERRREAEATCAEVRVDEAVLGRLRQAQNEVTRTEAALDAASPRVRFTANRDVRLVVDGEPIDLVPGEDAAWTVRDALTLGIADLGEVDVRAGAGSEDATDAHRRASEQLRAALDRAGVADLAAAEQSLRRREDAERTITEAERERQTALDGEGADELDEELDRLERASERYLAGRDGDHPLPDSIAAAQAALETATAEERRADDAVVDPTTEVEAARDALERERASVIELTTTSNEAARRLTAIGAELAEARAVDADDELDREVAAAERARSEARTAVAAAETALADADPAAVNQLADNAAAVAEDARARLHAAEQDLRDTRVRITALGGDGLWEQREALATELAHATTEQRGLHRRANAARLLRDTLERHRGQARDRYAAPLREQLVAYGRMLHGPGFDVELDDDLRVARRELDGTWLEIAQLSVGAREQLALLGRLACATLLGDHGGVLLFDDALGNTDPDRLERIGAVLRTAGQHTQVIVLTSYPDRYRHVGGARRVSL